MEFDERCLLSDLQPSGNRRHQVRCVSIDGNGFGADNQLAGRRSKDQRASALRLPLMNARLSSYFVSTSPAAYRRHFAM
jgi:hypothetical protein